MTSTAGAGGEEVGVGRQSACRGPRGALRIQGCEERQVTHIRYHLPELPVRHVPSGHRGISDTVSNVIKNLPIRHRGDESLQRRGPRIGARANLRLSAAVVRMAACALLPE